MPAPPPSLALAPSTSARNVIQPRSDDVSALTVKRADGTVVLEFELWDRQDIEQPNLVIYSENDYAGAFMAKAPGAFVAVTAGVGPNALSKWPHIQMDMGIDRPETEYSYENIYALFRDGWEYFASGFEWFDGPASPPSPSDTGNAHMFRWNAQINRVNNYDGGRYYEVVDAWTNRIIIHPINSDAAAGTETYTASFEINALDAGTPVLYLTGAASQTADMLLIRSSTGTTIARINTSGHYHVGANKVVGARVTGWTAASGTPTRSTFATGTVTLPQLAERVKALIDDLISHGLIGT